MWFPFCMSICASTSVIYTTLKLTHTHTHTHFYIYCLHVSGDYGKMNRLTFPVYWNSTDGSLTNMFLCANGEIDAPLHCCARHTQSRPSAFSSNNNKLTKSVYVSACVYCLWKVNPNCWCTQTRNTSTYRTKAFCDLFCKQHCTMTTIIGRVNWIDLFSVLIRMLYNKWTVRVTAVQSSFQWEVKM